MGIEKWNRIKPLEQETSVQQVEKDYGVSLSIALKECILKNNGGRPFPNIIKLKNGEEYDVKILLSYNTNDLENIYKVIQYFVDKYDGKVIPFAVDSAGNYYCEFDSKIVLWLQEDAIIPICDSFDLFLKMLDKI